MRRSPWSDAAQRVAPLALSVLVAGCAHVREMPRPIDAPGAPQAILLVTRPGLPAVTNAKVSKSGQAARGAAGGALVGALTALETGPFAPLVAPVTIATGVVVGGIAAPALGPNSGEVPRRSARNVADAFDDAATHDALAAQATAAIAAEAALALPYRVDVAPPDDALATEALTSHRAAGYASILEIAITRIGMVGGFGVSDGLAVYVLGEVATWDASSGTLAARRGIAYQSTLRDDRDWARDDGQPVARELKRAVVAFAQRAVESELLEAPAAPARRSSTQWSGGWVCGLIPLQPAPRTSFRFWSRHPSEVLRPVPVPSLQPRIEWQPYGGPGDGVTAAPVYDLRIWRADGAEAGRLVYERFGLAEPFHELEQPLDAGATYHWSVRPRFDVNGRPRALRWSAAMFPATMLSPTVSAGAYRLARTVDGVQRVACGPTTTGLGIVRTSQRVTACDCLDFVPDENALAFTTPR